MFRFSLYLAIPEDSLFARSIEKSNPHLVGMFTQGGDYLHKKVVDSLPYLGKPLPPSPSLEQLERTQINLISLLKKIAPTYPVTEHPPILLTLPDDS
ncbi:MAG: hypothetical protein K940chlam9_01475 [Chlamydiae bacterium]|nr:hypothetical protein [Chlamydiota bacterium]